MLRLNYIIKLVNKQTHQLYYKIFSGIVIHIHVTPYQIQDDRRPWIKKEEKSFHDILCQLGAPVNRVVHFVNTPPNLFMHFDVLITFKQVAADAKSTNDLI